MTTIALDDYPITIGTDWQPFQKMIQERNYPQIVVIVDENTEQHCLPILRAAIPQEFHRLRIPAGEKYKTLETCQLIWSQMMNLQLSRGSLCINLGGGVIGDMGGFCASTFKRGIDFIQIPTTLLSQVDASIGGKLGIDFQQVKNSIGVFRNPEMVVVNPVFLKTLPAAEIRSGFAEIIKHSLIMDAREWERIRAVDDLSKVDWPSFIVPSLKIKQSVVEQDPFEKGLRKALNFGHTVGHAIEGYALHTAQPLLHGEAIAIGMVCEAFLSHTAGRLTEAALMDILELIKRIYPYWPIPLEASTALIALMKNDKKNRGAEINCSYLDAIGQVKVDQVADEELLIQSFHFYNEMAR
jgi:3-dehydroquinate synthase